MHSYNQMVTQMTLDKLNGSQNKLKRHESEKGTSVTKGVNRDVGGIRECMGRE